MSRMLPRERRKLVMEEMRKPEGERKSVRVMARECGCSASQIAFDMREVRGELVQQPRSAPKRLRCIRRVMKESEESEEGRERFGGLYVEMWGEKLRSPKVFLDRYEKAEAEFARWVEERESRNREVVKGLTGDEGTERCLGLVDELLGKWEGGI